MPEGSSALDGAEIDRRALAGERSLTEGRSGRARWSWACATCLIL